MIKINKLKTDFSKILLDKYQLTQEGIEGYWEDKKKEEGYTKKRVVFLTVGAIGMCYSIYLSKTAVDNASLGMFGNAIITGFISGTVIAEFSFGNPYTKKEYREIDREYKLVKKEYKKLLK